MPHPDIRMLFPKTSCEPFTSSQFRGKTRLLGNIPHFPGLFSGATKPPTWNLNIYTIVSTIIFCNLVLMEPKTSLKSWVDDIIPISFCISPWVMFKLWSRLHLILWGGASDNLNRKTASQRVAHRSASILDSSKRHPEDIFWHVVASYGGVYIDVCF